MNNQLTSPLLSSTKLRSSELDFVKGVLITLMVLFHLSYFVERCTHRVGVHLSHVWIFGNFRAFV